MNPGYMLTKDIVVSALSRFPDGSLTVEAIQAQVASASAFVASTQGANLTADEQERLTKEVETLFNIWIGTARILEDDTGHERWLPRAKPTIDWKFWDRYGAFMAQKWASPAIIQSTDKLTDDILGRLENPSRPGEWDRRGLVVGHVQSGKTANYAGLICKAVDAGYRLIVVLAGMHNNLRSQTQVRLEEDFLGYSTFAGEAKQPIGAGLLNTSLRADAITDRTDKGDFSRKVANQFNISPGQQPLMFVVKKNASVLRYLLKWVQGFTNDYEVETGRKFVRDVPILVIDDEADQASVNSNQLGMEPTKINSLIRQLLFTFAQSAYVGYTATPFANIFIHDEDRHDDFGQNLFPRSFIVGLPTPSNYMGPARVFGLDGDPDAGIPDRDPLGLVRHADDGREWIPDRHKKDLMPSRKGRWDVPDSLHEAILAFILTGAAKEARGLGNQHHSMLVHVTRFTAVQGHVARQVGEHLDALRNAIAYGQGAAPQQVMDELRELWEADFVPTTTKVETLLVDGDEGLASVGWDDVQSHIGRILGEITVHVINGSSADALEYEESGAAKLRVIAVGGDKLSRGLTLEGLSTSYFLRSSKMYDTLMQMGRWFGYRQGYIDLCRLYLPEDLEEWFEHITEASEELRRELDYMTITGGTPKDYGLRVRSHSTMLVTSQVKMRAGVSLRLSFAGEISETVVFPKTAESIRANHQAVTALLERLGDPDAPPGSADRNSQRIIWSEVPPSQVTRFLRAYSTHPLAWRVNRDLLAEFIEKQNARQDLMDWTICLVSNDDINAPHRVIAGYGVGLTRRGTASSGPYADRLTIRRLVSPTDEAVDLSKDEYAEALANTPKPESKDGVDRDAKRASGRAIRAVRRSKNGLLLLYPLDPVRVGRDESLGDKETPVMGFAISFPEIKDAAAVDYKVNHVYWEQYYGANDWDDDDDEEGS